MEHCPQCGGLIQQSHKTRTVFEKGELFKEKRTWDNCIDCNYYDESTDSEKIADVQEPNSKGVG